MILTGSEIVKQIKLKNIVIKPFNNNQVNPNSYNYRLGSTILVQSNNNTFEKIILDNKGFVLEPHKMYLASTYETLGSKEFAMSLIGRSSLGRLGLFLQVSANLGHTGSSHKWTLELVAAKPIRIYKNMVIGQISFWTNKGGVLLNSKGYADYSHPKQSLLHEELI